MSSTPFEERATPLPLVRDFLLALEQPESADATRAAQQFVRLFSRSFCAPPAYSYAVLVRSNIPFGILKFTLQTERLLERVASIKAELAATHGLDVSAEEQRQLLAQLQIVAARKRFDWGSGAFCRV